jgi:hypothetical protein
MFIYNIRCSTFYKHIQLYKLTVLYTTVEAHLSIYKLSCLCVHLGVHITMRLDAQMFMNELSQYVSKVVSYLKEVESRDIILF